MKYNNNDKPTNIRKPYSRKPPQQSLPSLNHLLLPSPPSKLDRISLPPPAPPPVYQTIFYEEEDYLFRELLSIYSTDEQVLNDASFFFFGNTTTCFNSTSLPSINTSKDFVLFEPLEQQQQQHSSIKKKLIADLDNKSKLY